MSRFTASRVRDAQIELTRESLRHRLVAVALALIGMAGVVTARCMPRRTLKGSQLLQQVLGFRLYMRTAERHRQQFAEKENLFTAFLPYAIVFSCGERWAKAFVGLADQSSETGWYGSGAGSRLRFRSRSRTSTPMSDQHFQHRLRARVEDRAAAPEYRRVA